MLETNKVYGVDLGLNMDLRSLDNSRDTIWTLFMHAGYLTVDGKSNPLFKNLTLRIPNLEIKENLTNLCIKWFNQNISYQELFERYLIYHDMDNFKNVFTKIVEESFSYYDVGINNGENFYHAFTMGLLYSTSNDFKIISNREVGYGRFDLLLKPINKSCNNAYIIEFKSIDNNNFDKTIREAFKQIKNKNMK